MLFKSFFESRIAFNPSMLLRFFPFKYNLVGYQVYCTSIFTANCNLRGTFWPILRSVFASLVDVFQALRWFQRGRGFKRRRCCCIPNFPNPQLGFSSCIREKVSTNLPAAGMQLFSFSPNSLTLPFSLVPLLTQFHLIFLLLNFNFQCCLEFYSTVKEILAQSRFPTL